MIFCILLIMSAVQDIGMPWNTTTVKKEEMSIQFSQFRQFRLPIPTFRAGMHQQRFEPTE
jgi:hypothetical protein